MLTNARFTSLDLPALVFGVNRQEDLQELRVTGRRRAVYQEN